MTFSINKSNRMNVKMTLVHSLSNFRVPLILPILSINLDINCLDSAFVIDEICESGVVSGYGRSESHSLAIVLTIQMR